VCFHIGLLVSYFLIIISEFLILYDVEQALQIFVVVIKTLYAEIKFVFQKKSDVSEDSGVS
jgi:hypothetical protein